MVWRLLEVGALGNFDRDIVKGGGQCSAQNCLLMTSYLQELTLLELSERGSVQDELVDSPHFGRIEPIGRISPFRMVCTLVVLPLTKAVTCS